jgi:hypothetical protein
VSRAPWRVELTAQPGATYAWAPFLLAEFSISEQQLGLQGGRSFTMTRRRDPRTRGGTSSNGAISAQRSAPKCRGTIGWRLHPDYTQRRVEAELRRV